MFPVRGDVRFVDGKQTLVFTGSQKAIIWLNKIFATMHESSPPVSLQKFSRRSRSAPCRLLSSSPGEWATPHGESGLDVTQCAGFSPRGSRSARAIARERSPRDSPRVSAAIGAAVRKAKVFRSPETSTDIYQHRRFIRQKKAILRGTGPLPTSPLDSTFSSRAKSCERVRSKQSSTASSPQKKQSALPTTPNSILTAASRTQRLSMTPRRTESRKRPPTPSSAGNKNERILDSTLASPVHSKKTHALHSRDGETSPRQTLRSKPSSNPRSTPTSPNSLMGKSSRPSSVNFESNILSTSTPAALLRNYGTSSSRLIAIPEIQLYQRVAPNRTPNKNIPVGRGDPLDFGDLSSSGQASQSTWLEPIKTWDYTQTPASSESLELDRNTVDSAPIGGQNGPTEDDNYGNSAEQRECPTSSPPPVAARTVTPISPDFLRTIKDEESWRQIQSPHPTTVRTKKFFRNPLFNRKACEKKKSFSALRNLAYPDVTESTFKHLSFATKKFMAKMTGINRPGNRPRYNRGPAYLPYHIANTDVNIK